MNPDRPRVLPVYVVKCLISAIGLVLLLIHVRLPSLRVDAVTFGLVILTLLPWFSEIISSAELPGGWKVEFRELRHQQELQADEINSIRYLVSHFTTAEELLHLRRLASGDPFPISAATVTADLKAQLRRLRAIGLIRSRAGRSLSAALRQANGNLAADFEVTAAGQDYLEMVDESEEDDQE